MVQHNTINTMETHLREPLNIGPTLTPNAYSLKLSTDVLHQMHPRLENNSLLRQISKHAIIAESGEGTMQDLRTRSQKNAGSASSHGAASIQVEHHMNPY